MMAKERAGVQVGTGHVTAVEGAGTVHVLSSDGSGRHCKVTMGIDDARHLATMLRRIARRVERQGLK